MRKIVICLTAFISVLLMLTSCLGESKGEYESGNEYAYITTTELGTKIAYTSFSVTPAIYSDFFKNLETKRFYQIKFKVDTSDGMTEGVYNAKNVQFANPETGSEYIPFIVSTREKEKNEPVIPAGYREIYPTALSRPYYSPFKDLGDNFVFSYTCRLDKKEIPSIGYSDKIKLLATVVEKNQNDTGSDNEPLDTSKLRINLSLVIEGEEESSVVDSEKQQYQGVVVVDLSDVRRIFESRGIKPESETSSSIGIFEFEYKKDENKTEPVTSFLGTVKLQPSDYQYQISNGTTYGMVLSD